MPRTPLAPATQGNELTADQADPAAAPAERIAPADDGSEIVPPCGGNWLREADGGLRPRDADTARAAGLHWPQP